VVIQRYRERVRQPRPDEGSIWKRRTGASFSAKLRHVDPPNLERINVCKSQRHHREVSQCCRPCRWIQICPRRRYSRWSQSKFRHSRRIVVKSTGVGGILECDVSIRIPEESVPHAASCSNRTAKQELESAAQRTR